MTGDESVLDAILRSEQLDGDALGLTPPQRLQLEQLVELCRRAISERLKAHVRAAVSSETKQSDTTFGLRFDNGAVVTLDRDCARSLVDALAVRIGGMRGTGQLTGSEHGMLESVALEVVHHLGQSEREAGGTTEDPRALPALTEILRGADAQAQVGEGARSSIGIRLSVAGRSGHLTVHLPGRVAAPELRFPEAWRATQGQVRVSLALAPIQLPESQLARITTGDVVLLGVPDLRAPAAGVELVTTSGWKLATASVVDDTATMTTVRCGAWDPGAPSQAETREGHQPMRLTLGELLLGREQLSRWQEGATLGLKKDTAPALWLHRRGHPPLPAELVRVDAEIGARVIE